MKFKGSIERKTSITKTITGCYLLDINLTSWACIQTDGAGFNKFASLQLPSISFGTGSNQGCSLANNSGVVRWAAEAEKVIRSPSSGMNTRPVAISSAKSLLNCSRVTGQ